MNKRRFLSFLNFNPVSYTYSSLHDFLQVDGFYRHLDSFFISGHTSEEGFVLDFGEAFCPLQGYSVKHKKKVYLSFISEMYYKFLIKRIFIHKRYRDKKYISFIRHFFKEGGGLYIHSLSQKVCEWLNKEQIIFWRDNRIVSVAWESFVFYCRWPSARYYPTDFGFYKREILRKDSYGSCRLVCDLGPPHNFFCFVELDNGDRYGVGGWWPLHRLEANCFVKGGYPVYVCELLD